MNFAVVVDSSDECRCAMPGIPTISARSYLMENLWRERRGLTVINRCRSRGYQRYGYYVSLLAEARGHRAIPGVAFIKDFGGQPARLLAATVQNGVNRCRPRRHGDWRLAILRDSDAECPASNDAALGKFERAALAHGILPERVGRDDIARLPGFDALFIRDNTFVRHYTYRFSRRAADAGMALVDDPDSLLRCNSKVYLAELLPRHGIPIPRTLIVDRGNIDTIAAELGLPCVLKRPDSSLSLGVVRVDSLEELLSTARHMLLESDLLVAQEYLPTPFDWRIAVLDGRPLFACKYHMVPGHWQIVRHVPGEHYEEGRTEALPLGAAPKAAVELALRAAHLIGDGFYGVDLKELAADDFRVIEVNDNPNVDAGNEDGVLGDALYGAVMEVFARRMAARRRWPP
jgi:glutathione synthase/RimK-type ligase-like ATP-grasp enzyme